MIRPERIISIDFARGMALLGILFVNAGPLLGPMAGILAPGRWQSLALPDRVAALLVQVLFQSKGLGVFSLLFGYGLFGQLERSGQRYAMRRLLVLGAIGGLHATLIWYGDILFIYALVGLLTLSARKASLRDLLRLSVSLLLVVVLLRGGLEWLGVGKPESSQSGSDITSSAWIAAETAAYREGPWLNAQMFRLGQWGIVLAGTGLFAYWQILALFLLGGALWRVRFFASEQADLRRRLFAACLPPGLVLASGAAWCYWNAEPGEVSWMIAGVVDQLALCFLPLGYLAGLAVLAPRLPGWLSEPVCSAGRMSLTVYLAQSVVLTLLAAHWGLRWFGQVGPLSQVALAGVVWLGLVVLSAGWSRCVAQGPMEALLRWLTREISV